MAPQTADRPAWFVGVKRAAEQAPVGAGFLFAPGQIVTCAHVVDGALPQDRPAARLWIVFAFCAAATVDAEVVPGGWFPDDDIAVLRLLGPAPAQAVPARLAASRALSGHACTAHGYPRGQEWEATPARVTVDGMTERDRISVSSGTSLGFSFEPGYSGSPLWDHALGAVIGVVSQRVRPRASGRGAEERDPRAAFAISLDRVGRRWGPLADRIEGPAAGAPGDAEDTFAYLAELLDETNRAPLVGRTDIYDLGVAVSKYAPAGRAPDGGPGTPAPESRESPDEYVPRPAIDEALDRAFAEHDFVIAVGVSASGKSRSMAELLRRRVPGARVIVPIAEPTAPARLSRLDLGGQEGTTVLWLDDIHRFLGVNGIDLKTLDRFRRQAPPIKIVGTLTEKRLKEIQARRGEDNTSRMPSLVLNRATIVPIANLSGTEELTAARKRYPGEDFGERGIGETLVAARELDEMCLDGRTASPYGWAVLQAAIDWQRMGIDTPVSAAALRTLTAVYLDDTLRADFGDEQFRQGLDWATSVPAGSVIAPLQAVPPPDAPAPAESPVSPDEPGPPVPAASPDEPGLVAYRAHDYLVEVASGYREAVEGRPVPQAAWDFVVAECRGADLLRVAFTSLLDGDLSYASSAAIALLAGEKALSTSEDPETASYAQLLLGYLQSRAGNQDSAIKLLEAAARSGIADVESAAGLELAGVLILTGELDEAERLLAAAMAVGDPGNAAIAKASLASILYQRGHIDRALTLLEDVLSADDDASAEAAGTMLAEIVGGGTRSGADAKGLVTRSAKSGWQPTETGVRQAVQPIAALPAAVTLSGILMDQGDLGRARLLLQRAYEVRTFESGPIIEAALGTLAIVDGAPEDAEALLQSALDSGDFVASTMARVSLAQLAYGRGDGGTARTMLKPVSQGAHAYYSPMAAVFLGELYLDDGDRDAALGMFSTAYQSGRSRWHYAGAHSLAVLYLMEDSADEHGRELLAEAAASPFPDLMARASDLMGDLLSEQGDIEGAEKCYWAAINSGDPHWSAVGRTDLAIMIADQRSDFDGAADLLAGATGARDPLTSARAHLVRGLVDMERGRIPDSIMWLHVAAASEHSDIAEPAHVYLAIGVARDSGELREAVETLDRLWQRIDGSGPEAAGATAPDDRAAAPATVEEAYLAHCDRFAALGEPGHAHAAALLEVVVDQEIEITDAALRAGATARLGVLLAKTDHLDAALEALESAVDMADPASEPIARRHLADVLFQLGELDAARRCVMPLAAGSLGVAGEGERPAAYLTLGRVAAAQQRPNEAVRWFGMAADSAADDGAREQIVAEMAAVRTDGVRTAEPARPPAASWEPAPPPTVSPRPARPSAGSFEILPGHSFEVFGQRIAVPGPPLPPAVLFLLGQVAIGEGVLDEARRWLKEAAASADASAAARATAALERLVADEEPEDRASRPGGSVTG